MAFHFEFRKMDGWPPLAWLARLIRGESRLTVFHGARVELQSDWFCEAVWAGDFSSGDFDRTDTVAGSGGRLRGSQALFAGSGACVDRLSCLRNGQQTWLSNSLACLLAALGGSVDRSYHRYFQDLRSIGKGLDLYKRTLDTSAGTVELHYFENLSWDGNALSAQPKPGPSRCLDSFGKYRDFLLSTMESVARNLQDSGRRHSLDMLGALSSGYDSTMVTTLASRFGCQQALCVRISREGADDSGEPIAPYLGVTPLLIPAQGWRSLQLPEVPFIAANACGEEVYLRGAEKHLAGRVLMSGYFGDQVWGKEALHPGPNLVWGGHGLSLAEYRLTVGFLHCPVAYWGARQTDQIHAISNASEMQSWDIPGSYSRPICRRIVEEAGVPRELFGMRKHAVAVLMHCNEFLSRGSLAHYLSWLREHKEDWLRKGRIPPLRSMAVDRGLRLALNNLWWAADKAGWDILAGRLLNPVHLRRYVFPWAIECMKPLYPGTPLDTATGTRRVPI